MGLLLRKLDNLPAWDLDDRASFPWLRNGEFQADPLKDLNTSGNKISVYEIDENEENLSKVAGALSVGRGKYDRFDYVLFPESVVSEIGFQLLATPGNTADAHVNRCHRDISEISSQRLVEFVERIFRNQKRFDSIMERELIKCIIGGLTENRITHASIKGLNRLQERADKLGLQMPPGPL